MVFGFLLPTRFPNRLTMRGIVLVLLSLAHSDYRSLGKWFTTIKTMSLLNAACPTLIELTDWLSTVRGDVPGPDHATSATIRKLGNGWSISGIATLQSGLPFSIMDSAAGTLFGPATIYTTGSLAPGATLADAGRSGSVSSRVSRGDEDALDDRAF
jgi:hypothetical protein